MYNSVKCKMSNVNKCQNVKNIKCQMPAMSDMSKLQTQKTCKTSNDKLPNNKNVKCQMSDVIQNLGSLGSSAWFLISKFKSHFVSSSNPEYIHKLFIPTHWHHKYIYYKIWIYPQTKGISSNSLAFVKSRIQKMQNDKLDPYTRHQVMIFCCIETCMSPNSF